MGRKLPADQFGVFPGLKPDRYYERDRVIWREFARRAGLPAPEERDRTYENLGNRTLPIFAKKEQIQKMIRDNQISTIEGETGSGKSTQVGQYALEMGYPKIIYLEPRRMLADNLADRIEHELMEQLGGEQAQGLIGVRHSERSTGYGKPIEVMTPDTFIRVFQEIDEEYADQPVLIIGDEIHERDFPTELGVAVAAQALEQNPKWRLTLMSATLDAETIQQAYGDSYGKEIPRAMVEGRPFELRFVEEPSLTVEDAYVKYRSEHQKAQIFVAGKREIRDTSGELRAMKLGNTRITPLHAKLSQVAIKQATHAVLRDNEKQAIPSTNAGQSGITIPGQTLVISDGTIRRPDLDPDGVEGLFKTYCARDEMIQQGGRAGRDVGGGMMVIARPDDEEFDFISLDKREPHAPAQIYHTNISNSTLAVTALGLDFYTLNKKWLMDKVKNRRILDAYETLYQLGAIDEYNRITDLGLLMHKFPLRPELARSVAEAVRQNADEAIMRQLIAITGAVDAGGLPYFEKGVGRMWRQDIREETKDDYIAQLDMFRATREFYDGSDINEAILESKNYDLQNTRKAHKVYDKICRTLGLTTDTPDDPSEDQIKALHDYLTAGLLNFVHRRIEPNEKSRTPTYVSVRKTENEPKHRGLSDRGTYHSDDRYVIGMPRRFEKHVGGVLTEFSVIENVLPTNVQVLTKYVLSLADRYPQEPAIVGGRLEQRDKIKFGDIELGEEPSRRKLVHTPETRAALREAAFAKQTQALQELTEIKERLERLVRRIPTEEIDTYFPNGVLTQDWLISKIEQVTNNDVDSIYLLDNGLRALVVREDIGMETWISEEKAKEIELRSPEFVELRNGQQYDLYYTHGVPIINGFNLRDVEVLPDEWRLDDGREIFIHHSNNRGDTKRYNAAAIKNYAKQASSL